LITIALDAMGGDHAPKEIVKGALVALNEDEDLNITLVGSEVVIREELRKLKVTDLPSRLQIAHASESIGMWESPSTAYKQKKNSSIHVGLQLVKSGTAGAFVSAGNTGAVMMASTLILGRINGIERPAIATVLPTLSGGHVLMLDMGATMDAKPTHLLQFGVMGHYYSQLILGVERPRVGLLNVGEEEEKGNHLVQAATELLQAAPIQFVGNVEGKVVLFDVADVVVCDGFVGNSLLKFGEGLAEYFLRTLRNEVKRSFSAMIGAFLMRPAIKRFKDKVDYEELGGAPLLGVNGVVFISHGSSGEKAIKNCVHNAFESVKADMIAKIGGAVK
jgi:phosphate acyltransferase